MRLTSFIIAALVAGTPSVLAKSKKDSAVLLSKVRSLTLRDGYETSHRRIAPLPQLNCVGGNAKGLYNVEEMRCKNSGSQYDAEDIQWTCQASMPPEFKLGSTEVLCEGYDSPDDPYILKGSCGVEYRLILTPLGEQKYGARTENAWRKKTTSSRPGEGGLSDSVATTLFWLVFAGIVCAILYSICTPRNAADIARGFNNGFNGGGGGGGGGHGDDGSDHPPPPYSRRDPNKSSSSRQSSSSSSSRIPPFLAGAATGAAAGYGAGAWNANRQNRNRMYQQEPPRAGPSSWFQRQENTPPTYAAGPSYSPPAPSSSRHESTGFGGTTRR